MSEMTSVTICRFISVNIYSYKFLSNKYRELHPPRNFCWSVFSGYEYLISDNAKFRVVSVTHTNSKQDVDDFEVM